MDAMIDTDAASNTATEVRLSVPRSLEYVPLARVTVAAYAARLGFDIEEIEDGRIAVDELARILVEVGDGATLDLSLRGSGLRLAIAGSTTCPRDAAAPQLDPITVQILSAIAHDYQIGIDSGTAWFRATLLGSSEQ